MECSDAEQHYVEEDGLDSLENFSENGDNGHDSSYSEMECGDIEQEKSCVGCLTDSSGKEKISSFNNCCDDKKERAQLRRRLTELSTEYNRLKTIMLIKLLECANLLVEYESTQSSRYLYVPDGNEIDQEMISRIALDLFPQFRQIERNQRILAELLDSGLSDEQH